MKAEAFDPAASSESTFNPVEHDLDVQAFRSSIKNPFGRLRIISDELLTNGVSYYFVEKTGLLQRRVVPILLGDEKLEKLSDLTWMRYSNGAFCFTGRRFLVVFNSFMQSKWIKPSFAKVFSLIGADHWLEGTENAYDSIALNLRLSVGLEGKFIEIGLLKHAYQADWESKVHSPSRYYLTGKKKEKIKDLFKTVVEEAQEAVETDALDLIALEDFCLTSGLEIHKIGFRELGSAILEQGVLNLGKKKIKP